MQNIYVVAIYLLIPATYMTSLWFKQILEGQNHPIQLDLEFSVMEFSPMNYFVEKNRYKKDLLCFVSA